MVSVLVPSPGSLRADDCSTVELIKPELPSPLQIGLIGKIAQCHFLDWHPWLTCASAKGATEPWGGSCSFQSAAQTSAVGRAEKGGRVVCSLCVRVSVAAEEE